MPYLIDGYNLYHAACKSSEELSHLTPGSFCCLIAQDMFRLKDHAVIVFDGRPHKGRPPSIKPHGFIKIIYTGPDSDADTHLEHLIQKNTAPRRLTVVSTDRRIRQAARRRRATSLTSLQYLCALAKRSDAKPPPPAEPREKRTGITSYQTDQWMKLFGLDPDAPDDPLDRIRF